MNHRPQMIVFAALLVTFAVLAFFAYLFIPLDTLTAGQPMPPELESIPRGLLALANTGIYVVGYGLLGLAGYWLSRRAGLPGIFREGAGWSAWLVQPLWIGAAAGVALVIVDQIIAVFADWPGFMHPEFPLSLIASATAGIGEEILFRLFVMGLWAFLLNLILKRWGKTALAMWIANGIAALGFAAAHLPAAMLLLGVSSPAQIPPLLLAELLVLNSLIGLLAGERTTKNGLVAAVGIHFWADVVWHVVWPLAETYILIEQIHN